MSYYENERRELEPFLPSLRDKRVLELGCGGGRMSRWLKSDLGAEYLCGVELDPVAGAQASAILDELTIADLDTFDLPDGSTFDVVICADVIEHLKDPWQVLERVFAHVSTGGYLITSTPNLRNWQILRDLVVKGDFQYESQGLRDRTHLRWFTQKTIIEFHEKLGLRVEEVGYVPLSGKSAKLDLLTSGVFRDFLVGQHVVRSRKP